MGACLLAFQPWSPGSLCTEQGGANKTPVPDYDLTLDMAVAILSCPLHSEQPEEHLYPLIGDTPQTLQSTPSEPGYLLLAEHSNPEGVSLMTN